MSKENPHRGKGRTGQSRKPDPSFTYSASSRAGYTVPGFAILPLRVFLAVTFIYAGYQKLADPGFFQLGAPTYIGTQLRGFSQGSPISFLLQPMLEYSDVIGYLTIATELIVGFMVLLGLLTRCAVIAGFILNLVLFLSASWRVYPYFLGADIVFLACWLTLALTGPGPFALDRLLWRPFLSRLPSSVRPWLVGPLGILPPPDAHDDKPVAGTGRQSLLGSMLSRREAVVGGAITLGVLILGLIPRSRATDLLAGGPGSGVSTPAPSSPTGHLVGRSDALPINSALAFTDPKSGDPAVVIHATDSKFYAYDAVCTHSGCTVEYDQTSKLLVCPCHGGAFDPVHAATVVAGPPPTPLAPLAVRVDSSGNIYIG